MAQDLNPVSWGAQDRFQAHFVVKAHHEMTDENFLARSTPKTKGHFASKRVVGAKWLGGALADALNADAELGAMMTKLSYKDARIYVEPTKGGIRIHGAWKDSYEFSMTKDLFAV